MAHHNWDAALKDFLETTLSIKQLAEKYTIPEGTLRSRATRDKWVSTRDRLKLIPLPNSTTSTQSNSQIPKGTPAPLERHLNMARMLQHIGGMELKKLIDKASDEDKTALEPREILNFVDTGVKLERLVSGESTVNVGVPALEAFVALMFEAAKQFIPEEAHERFINYVTSDPRAKPVAETLARTRTVN